MAVGQGFVGEGVGFAKPLKLLQCETLGCVPHGTLGQWPAESRRRSNLGNVSCRLCSQMPRHGVVRVCCVTQGWKSRQRAPVTCHFSLIASPQQFKSVPCSGWMLWSCSRGASHALWPLEQQTPRSRSFSPSHPGIFVQRSSDAACVLLPAGISRDRIPL